MALPPQPPVPPTAPSSPHPFPMPPTTPNTTSPGTHLSGTVIAWGDVSSNEFTDVPPEAQGNVIAISAGDVHSIALLSNGNVIPWGAILQPLPSILVSNQVRATAISAGLSHNLVLLSNGNVVAWGWNDGGQCNVPDAIQGRVIAISGGGAHSLALLSNGTVVAWGDNRRNQIDVPASARGLVIKAISAGNDHSLALLNNGTVVAWGYNLYGQCNVPDAVQGNAIAISAGYSYSLALLKTGNVVAWGLNQAGICDVPSTIQGSVNAISAGYSRSLALLSTGDVVAWGYNYVPATVRGNAIAIAAGGPRHLAIVNGPPRGEPPISTFIATHSVTGGLAIGLGTAGGVCLIVGVMLSWWLCKKRRRSRDSATKPLEGIKAAEAVHDVENVEANATIHITDTMPAEPPAKAKLEPMTSGSSPADHVSVMGTAIVTGLTNNVLPKSTSNLPAYTEHSSRVPRTPTTMTSDMSSSAQRITVTTRTATAADTTAIMARHVPNLLDENLPSDRMIVTETTAKAAGLTGKTKQESVINTEISSRKAGSGYSTSMKSGASSLVKGTIADQSTADSDVTVVVQNRVLGRLRIAWSDIELGRVLGQGGFGTVYLGSWQGNKVAVKMLNKERLSEGARAALHQEVLMMCELRHPSIASAYGLVDEGDNHALVMRYYKRGTLANAMNTFAYQQLELVPRLKIAMQVATGMCRLHEAQPKPIVHGDLKVSNILLDDDGLWRVVIADFGLACSVCANAQVGSPSAVGMTISISPPEVLQDPCVPRTLAVDSYAFAIVLLQIVTGASPYRNMRAQEIMYAVQLGHRPPIPDIVPDDVAALIQTCWAQDPAARPRFKECVLALKQSIDQHSFATTRGHDYFEVTAVTRPDGTMTYY